MLQQNLITAEHGGKCIILREECYFFVNKSNLEEQNVKTPKPYPKISWPGISPRSLYSGSRTHFPDFYHLLVLWLWCVYLDVCFLPYSVPLTTITTIAKLTTNQVMVHYQTLDTFTTGEVSLGLMMILSISNKARRHIGRHRWLIRDCSQP